MSNNIYQQYIKHLDSIVRMYEDATKDGGELLEDSANGICARAEAAVQKICGDNSPYRERVNVILLAEGMAIIYKAWLIIGILKALKGDLEDGYLYSFPELVRGEMFEEFIEMAEHLLEEGYKDAAGVIAGSSLESHLRQLSNKHGVAVDYTAPDGSIKHKRAEQLNQELGKNAYSLFDQKQITAWLDLRNNAAHGQYAKYSTDQVARLIEWVRDFIAKNPA